MFLHLWHARSVPGATLDVLGWLIGMLAIIGRVQGLCGGDVLRIGHPAHVIRQQRSERHAGYEPTRTCPCSLQKRTTFIVTAIVSPLVPVAALSGHCPFPRARWASSPPFGERKELHPRTIVIIQTLHICRRDLPSSQESRASLTRRSRLSTAPRLRQQSSAIPYLGR